jgi:hypothetical protein
MTQTVYVSLIAGLLLLSGAWHLAVPRLTESWMSRVPAVRLTGVILIVLGGVSLYWSGWYFRALCLGLLVSGFWRLTFPQNSIHMQQRLYSRRVHGCLLVGGAILVWSLRP